MPLRRCAKGHTRKIRSAGPMDMESRKSDTSDLSSVPGERDEADSASRFEEVVTVQLDFLRKTLLDQYKEETEQLRSANSALLQRLGDEHNGIPAPSPVKSNGDVLAVIPYRNVSTVGPLDRQPVPMRWYNVACSLLEQADGVSQDLMTSTASENEGLSMRPAWKFAMHGVAKNDGRSAFSSEQTKAAKASVRINDFVKDESCLQPFVIPPQSRIQLAWSLMASCLILWDAITIPLEMFNVQELSHMLQLVGYFSFTFWMLDVPLHFFFGVQLEGTTELRPAKLAKLYIRGWFIVDVLVVSMDMMIYFLEAVVISGVDGGVLRSARYLRTLRLLRLFRLLRVLKLYRELSLVANRMLSTYAYMVMKVVGGLFLMLCINHLIACGWYGIASLSDGEKSWLAPLEMQEAGFAESYAASMHWALTQFTPATNNIAPHTAAERFFAIWVILLAMGVFSSFIGSISATVSSLRTARMDQFQKQSKLLQFFIERDLSVDLYGKVQEILKREGHFQMRLREEDVLLIGGIPERFKMELHEEMFMGSVLRLGCWPPNTNVDEYRVYFRNLCHRGMSEVVATPAQDIFLPGVDCKKVYQLQSGSGGYAVREQLLALCRGNVENDVLCLTSIWAEWYYRGRLTANSMCYIMSLDVDQFCKLATSFGGSLVQYLQIFGILLVGALETMEEKGKIITDLSLEAEKLDEMGSRAQRFATMASESNEKAHSIFRAAKSKTPTASYSSTLSSWRLGAPLAKPPPGPLTSSWNDMSL
mmetsp:Transcript_40887/g.94954  ORF Transcript_40887/g.94954 Transcript_40887/m.94954 type:complete len:761 (-) Transcript_40887:89-2371(-)